MGEWLKQTSHLLPLVALLEQDAISHCMVKDAFKCTRFGQYILIQIRQVGDCGWIINNQNGFVEETNHMCTTLLDLFRSPLEGGVIGAWYYVLVTFNLH